jgi:hypothetical protein
LTLASQLNLEPAQGKRFPTLGEWHGLTDSVTPISEPGGQRPHPRPAVAGAGLTNKKGSSAIATLALVDCEPGSVAL